ncbi:hypothetical protein [Streptomyces sp. NPDC050738]|uniref:hypothetical protein n=1 Tax=Streptomyces sp. NPDC050738 TaxID=3154744 RepID=UPI00343FCE32
MPTYEQLYHLNLSNLQAAAEHWEEAAAKFKGLHTAYGDQVARPFQQAGWTQPFLTVAKASADVYAAQQQFESAHAEAQGIAGVLTSLHATLKQAKADLHRLADFEAKVKDLQVSAVGMVTPRVDISQDTGARHDPDGQAAIRQQQEDCEAFAQSLVVVLQRAAGADETASWALRRDLGGSRSDFNSQVVTSLPEAVATRAVESLMAGGTAKTENDGWVGEGEAEASGPEAGASASGPDLANGSLGEAEAHATLGGASAEGKLTNGAMELTGEAEASVGAHASASGSFSRQGISGEASAFAGAEASAKGTADYGPIGMNAEAEAKAGAEASASVGADKDGLHAGAEAFAGAKASASGGADIGGVGVGGTAEGWAGAGVEAETTFGKEADGKWHIGGEVGVAVGLGGKLGFETTVDPGKIVDTAGDAADAVGDGAKWVGHGISKLF